MFHNSGNSYTTDKSQLNYFDNLLLNLAQAPGGWTLPGNERSICDALNLSKLGRRYQPGWFSNFFSWKLLFDKSIL